MTDIRLVLTTAGSRDEARRIAEGLIDCRLAACVNIVSNAVSIYRWKGKVEEAEEWLLWIKTTAAAFERVRDAIKHMHSYELPECMCLEVDEASLEYLKWIDESVDSSPQISDCIAERG
ncbi:MAG TPA: divalent-cation tolerance protein CutA [Terriglobales bacterium]|jgi:periplasmic divalent cation tolerance protein|nr:divalent-cation tolerance protein CutA [Terriglobales bacterium]